MGKKSFNINLDMPPVGHFGSQLWGRREMVRSALCEISNFLMMGRERELIISPTLSFPNFQSWRSASLARKTFFPNVSSSSSFSPLSSAASGNGI